MFQVGEETSATSAPTYPSGAGAGAGSSARAAAGRMLPRLMAGLLTRLGLNDRQGVFCINWIHSFLVSGLSLSIGVWG